MKEQFLFTGNCELFISGSPMKIVFTVKLELGIVVLFELNIYIYMLCIYIYIIYIQYFTSLCTCRPLP